MGTCIAVPATRALAIARARQHSGWEARTVERREQNYQQRNVQSGDLMQSQIALAAFLFGLPLHCKMVLPTDPSPILRFSLGGWCRDKRQVGYARASVSDLRCVEV